MTSAAVLVSRSCPQCGGRLRIRTNRREKNQFLGCSKYPECKFTEEINAALQNIGERLFQLEEEMRVLRASRPNSHQASSSSDDLRDLLFRFHPDRNPSGLSAHDVVTALNELRKKSR